jgi:hypothetical protein
LSLEVLVCIACTPSWAIFKLILPNYFFVRKGNQKSYVISYKVNGLWFSEVDDKNRFQIYIKNFEVERAKESVKVFDKGNPNRRS